MKSAQSHSHVAINSFFAARYRFITSAVSAKVFTGFAILATSVHLFAAAPGTVDLSFDPGSATGTNFFDTVYAVLADSKGGVVIGGEFTQVDGASRDNIARLNANGSVDPTFQARVTHQGGNAKVDVLLLQGSQILVGGNFDSVNGFARKGLARLNADGTLDTGFNPALGFFPEVQAILLQPNGKIIVAGFAINASAGTSSRYDVVRLEANGNLDLTFDIGFGGVGGFPYAGALQPDGKVVIGGFFNSTTGPTNLARFYPDGTLDTTYWLGLDPLEIVYGLAIQPDGKIVIAGEFDNVSGITRYGYARINTNGTVDTTFELRDASTNQFSSGGRLRASLIQPDGKIILGGTFMPFGGGIAERIARFLPDGSPDPGFISLLTDGPNVETIGLQPDGKILVAGSFDSYGGVPRKSVVRLQGDAPLFGDHALRLQPPINGTVNLTLTTQPGRRYALETSTDLRSWSGFTNFYAPSYWLQRSDSTIPTSGRRFYRARILQ